MAHQTRLWNAIGRFRTLLELIPDEPGGETRLGLCVEVMRTAVEADAFPTIDEVPAATKSVPPAHEPAPMSAGDDGDQEAGETGEVPSEAEASLELERLVREAQKLTRSPDPQDDNDCIRRLVAESNEPTDTASVTNLATADELRPVLYARLEINSLVNRCREVALLLLPQVEIEPVQRDRLARELGRGGDFLDADDRGEIGSWVDPTGPTVGKIRNTARLDALAAFLDALRKQPFPVLLAAATWLGEVSIPPDVLSVDVAANELVFRGRTYPLDIEVCVYVELLLEFRTKWHFVSSTQIEERLAALSQDSKVVVKRLKSKLPRGLQPAVVIEQYGSRLHIERLLSNP